MSGIHVYVQHAPHTDVFVCTDAHMFATFFLTHCHSLTNKEVATSLQRHIKLLHDYNESKDIGQMLMGR